MPVTTRSQKRKADGSISDTPKKFYQGRTLKPLELGGSKSEDITILVGPQKSCFKVSKIVLLNASKFFKAALKPNAFKEGKNSVIQLPEIEPAVFKMIIKWISKQTTYEKLALTESPEIVSIFKTADYLLIDGLKREIIMDIAYRVATYLQDRYLEKAMTSYKRQVGPQATAHKSIHPKTAVEVMSSIYQNSHSDDTKHFQRCVLVIAAATEKVKALQEDELWEHGFTAMWGTAKQSIENSKQCRRCNTFWEKVEGCARRMLPWSNQECTCWRRFFNLGYNDCPAVGGMDAIK
ncbi:hypothetical protein TWF788_011227 [Orbilia oligospora]|uniref:BTB domain-containing protein n=1 Tax=Orbilia oligospora TaxID=2813651 RepID=A0A7C8UC41_ORBOL|nr:hypothetical protein TWF788_011227 [Orbilia oligospora]